MWGLNLRCRAEVFFIADGCVLSSKTRMLGRERWLGYDKDSIHPHIPPWKGADPAACLPLGLHANSAALSGPLERAWFRHLHKKIGGDRPLRRKCCVSKRRCRAQQKLLVVAACTKLRNVTLGSCGALALGTHLSQ